LSLIIGFIILLMILFLFYMTLRYIKRKTLITLLVICGQTFILTIAILCFSHNISIYHSNLLELGYLTLGIILPSLFLISDYLIMISNMKQKGLYYSLIKPGGINYNSNKNSLKTRKKSNYVDSHTRSNYIDSLDYSKENDIIHEIIPPNVKEVD